MADLGWPACRKLPGLVEQLLLFTFVLPSKQPGIMPAAGPLPPTVVIGETPLHIVPLCAGPGSPG